MKNFKNSVTIVLIVSCIFSCKKWVETPIAKNQVESQVLFLDSVTATTTLLGVYFNLSNQVASSFKNIHQYGGDLINTTTTPDIQQYGIGKLAPDNNLNSTHWGNLYNVIYQCNAVLENIDLSKQLSFNAKKIIGAEAHFLRAFAYFYLYYSFTNIPLIVQSDVKVNVLAHQASSKDVLQLIHSDLKLALEQLPNNYIGTGRVRVNQSVAKSLLARLYLYQQDWQAAQKYATEVISSGSYTLSTQLDDVFLSSSNEAIWQLYNTNGFVTDATALLPNVSTTVPSYVIDQQLFDVFTSNDLRKEKWLLKNTVTTNGLATNYFYVAKFKNRTTNTLKPEYLSAFRLAELYLIRAEAFAQQNQIELAINDVNKIRVRAGLSLLPANLTKIVCIKAIQRERRLELFAEFGHRFYDLKRWDLLQQELKPYKAGWSDLASPNFPIPINEILYNKNLKQNEGY